MGLPVTPLQCQCLVRFDDRSGQPDETQANNHPKTNKKETTKELGNPLLTDSVRVSSEIPEWQKEHSMIWCL